VSLKLRDTMSLKHEPGSVQVDLERVRKEGRSIELRHADTSSELRQQQVTSHADTARRLAEGSVSLGRTGGEPEGAERREGGVDALPREGGLDALPPARGRDGGVDADTASRLAAGRAGEEAGGDPSEPG